MLAWNKEQNVCGLSRAFDESNSNLKGLIDYWFKQDDSEQINGQALCSCLKIPKMTSERGAVGCPASLYPLSSSGWGEGGQKEKRSPDKLSQSMSLLQHQKGQRSRRKYESAFILMPYPGCNCRTWHICPRLALAIWLHLWDLIFCFALYCSQCSRTRREMKGLQVINFEGYLTIYSAIFNSSPPLGTFFWRWLFLVTCKSSCLSLYGILFMHLEESNGQTQ